MESSIWGPPMWFFLHTISIYYPDNPSLKIKNNYYNFFNNLQNMLPCNLCQKNYIKHLQQIPITPYLDSKKSLFQWVINLHNKVNIENNKPTWTEKEVLNLYKDIYNNKTPFCHHFQKKSLQKIVIEHYQKQKNLEDIQNRKKRNKIILFCFLIFLVIILIILLVIFIKKKLKSTNNL